MKLFNKESNHMKKTRKMPFKQKNEILNNACNSQIGKDVFSGFLVQF